MRMVLLIVLMIFYAAFGAAGVRADSAPALGDEDPFAVLGTRSAGNEKSERVKTEGSVYLKNVRSDPNSDSRINPDSSDPRLQENLSVLETRLTLSDKLDISGQWRWLFKGFNAVSSAREPDGSLRDEARVDELFVDWKAAGWFASLGKRRINWGHAQGFNPVNVVVPPRDPLDPGRETEGQPMAWINRVSGAQSVDAVMTRNYDRAYLSDQTRWGLKWSFAAGKSDYALYYFDGSRDGDGRRMERMLGGSFSADIFPGITLYMEAARFGVNNRNYYDASNLRVNRSGAYWQAVAGSSVSLGGKRRAVLEYFRNDQGYSKMERLNYFRAADTQLAGGTDTAISNDYFVTGMNRNYALVSYQDEFRERYLLDMSALFSGDQSYSLRVQGKYTVSDRYELRMVLLHNKGARASEFGNNWLASALELGLGISF